MLAELICIVSAIYYFTNGKNIMKDMFNDVFKKHGLDYKVKSIVKTKIDTSITVTLGYSGYEKLLLLKETIECTFNSDVHFIHNENKSIATIYLVQLKYYDFIPSECDGNMLYISNDYQGKEIIIDMNYSPHVLCSGNVGTGKTEEIKIILTNLIFNKQADIYMADLSLVNDYEIISKSLIEYARSLETSEQLFKHLLNEYDYRLRLFSKYNCKNIIEYNLKSNKKLKYIYLVLDEFADFFTSSKKDILKQSCNDKLKELIRKSRKTGIFIICGIQQTNSNILDTNIKGCFCTKICFSQNSNVNSVNVCDSGELLNLENRKALLISNTQREYFKSLTINNYIIKNCI